MPSCDPTSPHPMPATIGLESPLGTVHGSMLRADATVLRDWRHSYNLLARDGALRILLATFNAA